MKASDRPVGVGLLGIGLWSTPLADAVRESPLLNMVNCFTRTPEKRERFAGEYGCRASGSYEALLEDPEVEGVLISTPSQLHAEQAIMAARAGKHVFVEKPMANTIADAELVIAECRKFGVVLQVGLDKRRFKAYRKMKELIDGGAIGIPVAAEANFSHDMGLVLGPERWHYYRENLPGGVLMQIGIHVLDALTYLLGPIKRVRAMASKLATRSEIFDTTSTLLEFESGAHGFLGCHFNTPKTWFTTVYGTEGILSARIRLPQSSLEDYIRFLIKADEGTELLLQKRGVDGAEAISFGVVNTVVDELEDFARCVRAGTTPETGGKEGLLTLAMVLAAMRSAEEGRAVEVAELLP
ncbi:MAG: Gfo/Idh/MocA family protein [Nitrospinota bacterium]